MMMIREYEEEQRRLKVQRERELEERKVRYSSRVDF